MVEARQKVETHFGITIPLKKGGALKMDAFQFFTVVLLWAIPFSFIIEYSKTKFKDTTIITLIASGVSYALFGLKNTAFIVIWVICVILITILIYRIISDLYGR